jgi:hypothetical protein
MQSQPMNNQTGPQDTKKDNQPTQPNDATTKKAPADNEKINPNTKWPDPIVKPAP